MSHRHLFFKRLCIAFAAGLCLASSAFATVDAPSKKIRFLVVSSYHREYVWSQDTQRGFCAAMLKLGYFDHDSQAAEYTRNDFVETSRVIVKKLWMDAKRKNSKAALEASSLAIYQVAKAFRPDLIFLGDDEAGEYVGRFYVDMDIPVVFWGFNDNPVKYGLIDTAGRPGHNVTGVYQSGYYLESLQFLRTLVPGIKTFAVLSDETVSGRTHCKGIEYLSREGKLPLTLVKIEATSDYEKWKGSALALQKKVDALYVVHFVGLKDATGKSVPSKEVARWYLSNITIPEVTRGHYVKEGMLCAADDSGYKQAFEAVSIAHDILSKGADPATYSTRTPARGALMVNRERAKMLGITLTAGMGIEEYIDYNPLDPDGAN